MKKEFVYKYRSGNDNIPYGSGISDLERDLRCLESNLIFASSIKSLNDPCEGIVFGDKLKEEARLRLKLLGGELSKLTSLYSRIDTFISEPNEKFGIYSLAGRYNHELLWAHYANSHKGFCIEYDLNELQNGYSDEDLYAFKIKYSSHPPQLSSSDISPPNPLAAIQKIAGFKSSEWEYENETRIVFNKAKLRHYNPKAITGIYFGVRMNDSIKDIIMKRLVGRNLKFYDIIQIPNTYKFERKEVLNPHKSDFAYLQEIPDKITRNGNVSFSITKMEYKWSHKKGIIETEFESPVSEEALKWLAELIKKDLFSEAERVFMMHRLKNEPKNGICWSNSDYILGEYKITINDYRLAYNKTL